MEATGVESVQKSATSHERLRTTDQVNANNLQQSVENEIESGEGT